MSGFETEGIAVVVGAVGYVVGRIRGKRAEAKRRYVAPERKPICGCGHHYAAHDKDGKCHSSQQMLVERGKPKTVRTGYEGTRHEVAYEIERWQALPCSCQHYTGPEPLPSVVSL